MKAGAWIPALFLAFLNALGLAEAQSPPDASSKPTTSEERTAAPTIIVRELIFEGVTEMPLGDQDAIAAEVKAVEYAPRDWPAELAERVRDGWQHRGYFRAIVQEPKYQVLSGDRERFEVASTLVIDEGLRYRLGELRWKNVQAFSVAEVEAMFPMIRGEVFDTHVVTKGLEALREAYVNRGYINFTCVPTWTFDDEHQTIDLTLDMDEGKLFRVAAVEMVTRDPILREQLSAAMKLKVGDPYSPAVLREFFHENANVLLPGADPDRDASISVDPKKHTIYIRVFVDQSRKP